MSGPAAAHRIEDPYAFARASSRQDGEIAIASMRRLTDRLIGSAGNVRYVVQGAHDQQQRPMLELQVSGTLQLQCDRCLKALEYPLELKSRVLLAQPGTAVQDDGDPETPEWIEAGRDLDLKELVEDEILLGLPLSVRHDRKDCGNLGTERDGKSNSPFSKLSALLGTGPTDKR